MQKQEEKKEDVEIKDQEEVLVENQQEDTVKKEEEQKEYKNIEKKYKKKKIIIISSIIIAILAISFSVIFAVININNDKIISGVSINGIEVSGLTKEEAKGKLETIYKEKKEKEITLKYQDFETQINPELIEANFNIDAAVENAFNQGRDGNIFSNNYNILFTLIGKKNIDVELSLNEEVTNKTLKDASSNLPGAIKETSYYIEDDNLIITKGQKGISIDIEDTINKIKTNLKDLDNNNDIIEINVIEKEPDAIDIDKIHEEVYKEAKDAYYTKDPFEIFPEVNGVDFNVDEAKELIKEDKDEYTVKLTITKPKVTIEEIGSEAFPDRLAIFTTRYDASNVDRTTNLRIACQKINGTVLMPGETFSYNKTLGERTIAAGYKEAKIYSNGQVVDGLGGGICQISSTLYNAVLMSNLEIVERRNHQFVTSYLPAGRDATVVYGLTDFKFKNSRKYPIKLNANVQNGIATVTIFGIKEEEEYTISFETRTIATLPVTTKYIDDASLAEGQEVVTQKGTTGVQTETYIIKSLNGNVVSKSLLSKDTYNAMQRIVKRGTKKTTTTPATTTPKTENTTPASTTPVKDNTTTNNSKNNTTNNTTTNKNNSESKDKDTNVNTQKTNTNTSAKKDS